ncbi:hypothetical protein IRP63_05315 [Clostridium botulinum]|uniref:Uncharacterized protein n=1 Tax=Clostridium botulinum C/D str. DC5 TaxID=1443128 RepID=A0A0A0IJA0_CLOBO|nr:DUF5986 family protein [Clostridium botulinum]KGN00327.1 hypothetical protein Z955_03875 [Clostridium botulinum C/D str. DC5]KOC51333.1 hypothetical protein ADU89_13800 [Clostridium botulinum]KOC53697.1 hypothetical protein ADU90_13180 [Clostridium botulinum]MCD3234596.1 hypothetical protein [Clostridium botulinum D/C]MCD3239739.1 hypothetical protein [Clostridium botulinum D/C]
MKKNILPLELLSDYKIKLIIKSINDAMPQYLNHVKKEELPTQNGRYHEIWNYIFKNIKNNFSDFPYKCYKISRGKLWEFIAIYDQKENILFVLMKEERFNQIKKDKNNDYHYIKILNVINNNISNKHNEQLCLFEKDNDKEEYIEDDLHRMIKDINGKIKICVNILFSNKLSKVSSISANISNYYLSEIKSYNWNKYIKADIDEIIDTEDEHNFENPPIELKIRATAHTIKNKERDNSDEIVKSKEQRNKKYEDRLTR